jgi:hypothetical protein
LKHRALTQRRPWIRLLSPVALRVAPPTEVGLDLRLAFGGMTFRLQSPKFVLEDKPALSGREKAGPMLRLMLSLHQFLFGYLMAFSARKHLS